MLLSSITRSLVILSAIDTVSSFTSPLPQVQHQQIHNRFIQSHWRHSGHDRYSLHTRYESKNVVDDIWSEGDKPTDLETGLVNFSDDDEEEDSVSETSKLILAGGTIAVLVAAGALAVTMRNDLGLDLEFSQLMEDPSNSFDTILEALGTMDPQKGMVPILTASSGYLFGLFPGTATCLFSAAIAASLSFVIGRTLLRGYVERVLARSPKFQSMDNAISKEGFKLMLLLRLSPLFPFALSNYLYGASSIRFLPYFFGTLFGFAPGTFAYVYAGRVGKALTIDSESALPWFVYVGVGLGIVGLLKIAGDVATGVIDSMDEDSNVWDEDMKL
eukprot:scaffold6136_cov135-Skeletonema_dohrnii-CCMP3373.AAC.8